MKNLKKIMAIILVAMMTMALGVGAFADTVDSSYNQNTHTITITNTDQNVPHTYEAYRVFAGHLDQDGQGTKLGNIVWGEGVNGSAILTALKASNVDAALTNTNDEPIIVKAEVPAVTHVDEESGETVVDTPAVPAVTIAKGESLFKYCETAADVAEVLSKFSATGSWKADGTPNTGFETMSAGQIDAFATIVAANLATKAADFTADENDDTKYTATVTGDGYYFVKDVTTNLTDTETTASDTKSKYLLAVVKDTEIVAKDTGITPDKKISADSQKVAADSAAIGDEITFVVTVDVPNTYKYEDHFVFNMNDQLPAGMTFTGITSVKVGESVTLTDATKETTKPYSADGYDGTTGYYTLKINDAAPTMDTTDNTKYVWEPTTYDAVKEAGGKKVTIVFNEFKKFAEKNNLVGGTNKVTVTYTAVLNDDAAFTTTANENEVKFVYSNDPNHDYTGDEITGTEPKGETPKSTTRTYTTSFKILKVDENKQPLANAIFELTGEALNRTVITGVKYEKYGYTAIIDETVDNTTKYWLLKDGSYTTTDPNGTGVNQSVYATPLTDTYVQVTYTTDEIAAKATTLQVASDSNGVITFTGLNEGTYTLKEIAAPDGFNKLTGTSTITISWDDPEDENTSDEAKAQGGFTITATDFAQEATFVESDDQFEVTIENKSGTQLPSTGGIGTTIFYVVGSVLVIGTGIVLVTRKRMGKEN